MPTYAPPTPPTTMTLTGLANLVLDNYILTHPGLNKHDKGRAGSEAILRELFPQLPAELRAELKQKYPALKQFA